MAYSNPASSPTTTELFSLRGRSALVIGGAGLLGGEIAYAFAEAGARLFIASRDEAKTVAFADGVRDAHPDADVRALTVDITETASIEQLFADVSRDAGTLDVLVNSGWSGRKNSFDSIDDEDWNYDIEVCLNGVFRTIKRAVPLMSERGGAILNIASMYGHVAPDYRLYDGNDFANPPSYGAAKAGILQLTRYLASFLAPRRIRVNAISPGPFPFESTQRQSPEFIERLAAKNPLGRIGQPHELKGAALLLCTDAGSYMTGANLCVDGGWSVW